MKRMILATLSILSLSAVAHADRFHRGWGGPGPGYRPGYGPGVVRPVYREVLLGTTRINGRNDFDTIYLGGVCVKELQIRVLGQGGDLDLVTVNYVGGGTDYIPVRQNFSRGNTSSVWIDVPGRTSCVREISIQGDAPNNWRGAIVQVLGRI